MDRNWCKRIILLLLSAAVLSRLSQTLPAASQTNDATVKVTVSVIFSLSLPDSVDIGSMNPGDWKEATTAAGYANAVICTSNTGNPWYLKISAAGPLADGPNIISLDNFSWLSTYAGNKNSPYQSLNEGLHHNPAAGYVTFTQSPELVYTSGLGASLNDNNNLPLGTEIQFKYALSVPSDPAPLPGIYTTTIDYTMTE
jgi:spore coat protein U-like protein